MAEEIGFENGRNSNFQGLVTLTLTLDPTIRHTVVHHSSTSTYILNFIEIEETFYGRTDVRTDIPPSNIIRSTFGSRPENMPEPEPNINRIQMSPFLLGSSLNEFINTFTHFTVNEEFHYTMANQIQAPTSLMIINTALSSVIELVLYS